MKLQRRNAKYRARLVEVARGAVTHVDYARERAIRNPDEALVVRVAVRADADPEPTAALMLTFTRSEAEQLAAQLTPMQLPSVPRERLAAVCVNALGRGHAETAREIEHAFGLDSGDYERAENEAMRRALDVLRAVADDADVTIGELASDPKGALQLARAYRAKRAAARG